MNLLLGFMAGMFLTNGVPHFVSGVMGGKHMTPFAKDSSALVNIVWGFVNFVFGLWIFNLSGGRLDELISFDTFAISFLLGAFALAIVAAWMFSNPNARFPWFKK